MLDKITLKGHALIEVVHDSGRIDIYEYDNIIVTTGRDRIAALFAQDSSAFPSHIAIGTGSVAVVVGDTALGTEVKRNAIGADSAISGVATFRVFFSKSDANGNTIAEAGVFDQSSGGTMFSRLLISPTITKTSSVSINITWTYTFADA